MPDPNQEEKQEEKKDLIDSLHKEGELSSLRTYQGDVASFMQSKDKSLVDVAIKNREEKEKKAETATPLDTHSKSIFVSIIGILLLVGSGIVISYVIYSYYITRPVTVLSGGENPILKSEERVKLDSQDIYGSIESAKADPELKGITELTTVLSSSELLEKLGWEIPSALERSLERNFILGVYSSTKAPEFFAIFQTKDYGIAFRDMLTWEADLPSDFAQIIGTTTEDYQFKDLIVKNKDTRAFQSKFGKVALIYTFLNQDTILITESETTLTALVNAFALSNEAR